MPTAAFAENNDTAYVVTVYNEQNGLPTSEANVVLQTSDGYIWIGSYGGLIRYDGTNFRNYSLDGDINSSSIRSLFEDSKGRLWIGTNDSGVVCLENNTFTEIRCKNENQFLCIRDFSELSDGTICVSSNSGIAKIDGTEIIPFETDSVIGETVYSLARDSHDHLWAAMSSGRCLIVDSNGSILRELKYTDIGIDNDIYAVESNQSGEIIVGSLGSTLAKIQFPTDSADPATFNIQTFKTGSITTHNQITVTKNDTVLISGLNGYGVLAPDGNFTEFDEAQNAVSINYSDMDYEGNLWLASSAYGIIKYTVGCFGSPNEQAGLGNTFINAITRQGDYWYVGLDTGLAVFDKSWNAVRNDLTDKLSGIRVRDVTADSSGNVWLAVYSDYAVLKYNSTDGSIVTYGESTGFISSRGRTVIELSDGSVAVGTQHGVAIIKNGEVTKSYGVSDGMENPYILSLLEGNDGTLYAGSDGNGIYKIKDGTLKNLSFSEGLSDGVVLRMAKNADSDGIFVGGGSNLYYLENETFRKLEGFKKGAGSLFDIYDKNGRLWIMQNSGILSVDKNKLLSGQKCDTAKYSFRHGLTGSLNANTWNYLDENGTLYIATKQGISTFGFEGVQGSVPKGIINKITVDDNIIYHPDSVALDRKANRITIDFAALTYSDTSQLNIAYYLEGFDSKETILADSKALSVSYTNLSGGNYTFKARIYSPQNPSEYRLVELPITKQKKLAEEPLFWFAVIGSVALVTALVAMLVSRAKMSGIRKRSDEYKNIVTQSLQTFAKTIDAKDKYTNGHSTRVAEYSREIARRMKMSDEEQERIYYVALLHDIGKIGIPDNILNKPGKLTDEEREIIQTHPKIGGEILKDFNALKGIYEGAKYHHERYDGRGYCEGKHGENIPLVARIIGVADTYDAMSSDRCYRKALSKEIIIEELKKGSGTQLDPEIVPYMLDMIEDGIAPSNTNR